ncbi:hypothetical protein KA478_03960 [Patescibacteria group bacterium]|nr:hypothetical protein [Patescibacteria group bacterium]
MEYPTVATIDRAGTYDALSNEEKAEYDKQKAELDAKIQSRLSYVQQFLPPDGKDMLQFSNDTKK